MLNYHVKCSGYILKPVTAMTRDELLYHLISLKNPLELISSTIAIIMNCALVSGIPQFIIKNQCHECSHAKQTMTITIMGI